MDTLLINVSGRDIETLIEALDNPIAEERSLASTSLIQLREDALGPMLERLAAGVEPGRMWDGLYRALGGLEEYGVLRGNLKRIVSATQKNSPTMPVTMVAKDLLVHIR